MKKMQDEWEEVVFNLTEYRDSGVSILSSCDDIQTILDDHIVKTITMKGSSFIKPFEKEIKAWEEKIVLVQETIDEWLKMQAQWLYLDPIFSSEDIMQQMPEEGRMFQVVDRNFKDIMKTTAKDPHVCYVFVVFSSMKQYTGSTSFSFVDMHYVVSGVHSSVPAWAHSSKPTAVGFLL